jgi:hypothetical protein
MIVKVNGDGSYTLAIVKVVERNGFRPQRRRIEWTKQAYMAAHGSKIWGSTTLRPLEVT